MEKFNQDPQHENLCRCRACSSDLVQHIDDVELNHDEYIVFLRCPECFDEPHRRVDAATLNRFSDESIEAMAGIIGDLKRLVHIRIEGKAGRSELAPDTNLILPEDF